MSKNNETVNNANTPEAVDTTVKVPKRASLTLVSGKGDKLMKITLLARRTRDGGETVVTTFEAKTKKTTRGMTTKYSTFNAAVDALGGLQRDAIAKGWTRTERVGSFKAKPDAFTTMPKAVK